MSEVIKLSDPVADHDDSPQPFAVTEVIACSHVYRSDWLYADDKGLLVNILLGVSTLASVHRLIAHCGWLTRLQDDQCESLAFTYSSIQDIDVSQSAQDAVRVTVSVREPPRLGKDPITAEQNTDTVFNLDVVFVFIAKDIPRLIDVFLSRGLVRDIPTHSKVTY